MVGVSVITQDSSEGQNVNKINILRAHFNFSCNPSYPILIKTLNIGYLSLCGSSGFAVGRRQRDQNTTCCVSTSTQLIQWFHSSCVYESSGFLCS